MTASAPRSLPFPTDALQTRPLPIHHIGAGTSLFRCHSRGRGALHFNRATGRFGPPDGVAFGTCYLGLDPVCAFMEALAAGIGDDGHGPIISESLISTRCLCRVTAVAPLALVDLSTGASLKRLHPQLDSRIGDGPHADSQRWAHAIWSHPDQPDGVMYRARNCPDRISVGLFDGAERHLDAPCTENLLDDSATLAMLLDATQCALIP